MKLGYGLSKEISAIKDYSVNITGPQISNKFLFDQKRCFHQKKFLFDHKCCFRQKEVPLHHATNRVSSDMFREKGLKFP